MDFELDLLRDLRDKLQAHDALVLGHVQAVVGTDLRQELECHQRADLTQYIGGRAHLEIGCKKKLNL